jgi:predicted TPR repeat methyltransferase
MGRSTMRSVETLPQALAAAVDLLRSERIDEAESVLQEVLQRSPDQPDALHFLGVLRHTQGQVGEAVNLIQRALAAVPNNASAWNNLGNVLLLAGRGEEAADAYDHAVTYGESTDAVRALNNLGVLHRKLGRLDRSELALRHAVERDPAFADAWYNLSTTLIKQGRVHDGLVAHSKAVALWPEDVQSRQEVIRALLLLDERERAARLLAEWIDSDPGNPVAEHILAACRTGDGAVVPERASDRYVQQVFDGFAASFDTKLEALEYRAPVLLAGLLDMAMGSTSAGIDVVDAGCGTGLCGPLLRARARHLAGCDLSVGMLRCARDRRVYDVLHQAELTFYLSTQPAAFDVVFSADTLCYFGVLDAALAAARRCLRSGGWLCFSVEALPDESVLPHRLLSNGRYAHHADYLWQALGGAGFEPPLIRGDHLRMEGGKAVRGWLCVAQVPIALYSDASGD